MAAEALPHTTPDGRNIVVRGRLWRTTDPTLYPDERQRLVDQLIHARREVAVVGRIKDAAALHKARSQVDAAKRGLGEHGPVWWTDGASDLKTHGTQHAIRHLVCGDRQMTKRSWGR